MVDSANIRGTSSGTLREELVEAGLVREERIHRDEVGSGARLQIINSVRGRVDADLRL